LFDRWLEYSWGLSNFFVSAHSQNVSYLLTHPPLLRSLETLTDGPPGTGKTSTIIAMAKKMYGEKKYKGMVLE
jgi:DNA polymerase III delta prime subunit